MKLRRGWRVSYACLLILAFCLLPFNFSAGEIPIKVGEVIPVSMINDENGNRTGSFTVNTRSSDVLLMVYSLSDSPGSHPFRLVSEKASLKKIKLPLYVRKATIPTATVYAEYYFRNRMRVIHFSEDSEPSRVTTSHPSKDFWVRRIENPEKFVKISADLKFTGEKCLIYKDKNIPDELIPSKRIAEIGVKFDKEIYPTNRTYFGVESDINKDSRITILITGMISNHAAFFDQKDLFPHVPYSNGQEIVFLRVPIHHASPDFFATSLAHEFQHLILINQRVFLRHAYPEERWLDEGLAYMAEYMNGSQAAITHAYTFLSAPQNYSLFDFTKPHGENQGTLGAVYLFMRYLVDRYGESILSKLAQTEKRGVANIEAATGIDFPTLYRDWIAALFLSNTGLNPNPIFNYKSLHLRDLQPPIRLFHVPIRYFFNGPVEKVLDLKKVDFKSTVEAMGVHYLRLKGSKDSVSLKLIGTQESKLEAAFIYLPKDYHPVPQAPVQIIEGATLDSPLPLLYPAKKKITLSGKVLNPDVKKVGLRFEPQQGSSTRKGLTAWSPVDSEGSFKLTFKFHHKGNFLMGMGLFVDPEEAPVKENIWVRIE